MIIKVLWYKRGCVTRGSQPVQVEAEAASAQIAILSAQVSPLPSHLSPIYSLLSALFSIMSSLNPSKFLQVSISKFLQVSSPGSKSEPPTSQSVPVSASHCQSALFMSI